MTVPVGDLDLVQVLTLQPVVAPLDSLLRSLPQSCAAFEVSLRSHHRSGLSILESTASAQSVRPGHRLLQGTW